jgi:hypothetical protein
MAGKPLLASLPSNCQSWATVAAGLRYSLVKDSELGWHAKTIALGVLPMAQGEGDELVQTQPAVVAGQRTTDTALDCEYGR